MKVLVTGGAGYIGSVVTRLLLDRGHEAVVFDNLERGHRQALDRRAKLHKGDLRNRSRIAGVMKSERPDAVLHFAAYALVSESMARPELYFANNVTGGLNLADAMLENGVRRIVFSSTCATYGQPDADRIDEERPQRPTNPYGESKLLLEKILAWHEAIHGMKAVFLRYFNAAGATETLGEDHDPETHLIPLVLQVALGRRNRISVYGDNYGTPDGTCIRDYIHVEDLADAHLRALESERSGAFNLGAGKGYSVREVVETACKVTGQALAWEVAPRRQGDPARLVADPSKAASLLGWTARRSTLRDIVESAWAWHRAHPDGYR